MIYTNLDKWGSALLMGLLFMVFASPYAYKATGFLTEKAGFETSNSQGCPTIAGVLTHALVFMLVVKLVLNYKGVSKVSNKSEWTMAFMAGLLFALVSSPYFNGLVKSVLGQCGVLSEYNNGPSYGADCSNNVETLLVNSGIYALITRLMM